jgi:hypothetical protein
MQSKVIISSKLDSSLSYYERTQSMRNRIKSKKYKKIEKNFYPLRIEKILMRYKY